MGGTGQTLGSLKPCSFSEPLLRIRVLGALGHDEVVLCRCIACKKRLLACSFNPLGLWEPQFVTAERSFNIL